MGDLIHCNITPSC